MNITALLLTVTLPFWQDIHTTSVNAETQRTEVVYFASREDALSKGFRESENYRSLNGTWDFKYFEDHRQMGVPSAWDKIQVPGNWEVQGWGTAIYTNILYDFCPENPVPGVLPETVPSALYRRSFTVPDSWKGREVYLNLCGSKSGTYVYVNGKEIGYCEDSKDLARFRITEALKPGENELMLKIYRYTQASWLEDQDFWRISGLERDVYLSSENAHSGFNFRVVSTLDADLTTGLFQLKMTAAKPTEVFYELLDKDGKAMADASFHFSGHMESVLESIPDVRRWSAETPELYTLVLRVNGEYTRFHVGFRRLEIVTVKDGERDVKAFLVNGQPVKFKGVNLHEHNPYTGHYTTRENILEDLRLMKLCNVNAIRTCHYPQQREFYELCDSLGFYVYDEANIETHGMGYDLKKTLGNKPEWYEKHLDRTLNMYYRTASYPCVTILSLGNEAGNGVNFYETYKVLKALEADGQNRPVVYERAEREWNTDIINPMYPGAEWFLRMGEQESGRPVIPCEYSHAMGNSNGSLDWQWGYIYAHKHLQGGFIWDWVDQGLYDKERGWTYGGDYGENAPSDANFCCNGLVNPDRDPHPGFYEVKHVYQDVTIRALDAENGLFEIFNRHYFTDLSNYKVKYWVERDGKRPFWWFTRKKKFQTAPQTAEQFKLRLPRMKKAGQYRIFFEISTSKDLPLIQKGTILACDEVLIKDTSAKKVRQAKGDISYTNGDTQVVVRSGSMELVFDKAEGFVKSWKVKGKDLVDPAFGIRPNFWRAPIDNDYGNNAPVRTLQFKTPEKPEQVSVSKQDNGTVLIALKGRGVRASENYIVYPDGTLTIHVSTAPGTDKNVEIPRLGFRFRVADYAFSYFGRGPVENYWDRHSGTFKRIWESSVDEQYYPYVRPQECGHHTDTEWLSVGGFTVARGAEPFEFNALRMSIEDLDGGPQKTQTHLCDVTPRDFTEVCIDYKMSGLGGYDSWGSRPERARTLWSTESYSYNFTLTPDKPSKAARYE
ncbi:MAG: beta-galactosidase [Bacteroidales bacterium]|nr:beta-galactosidase [Bacteroidales bacterium]